MQLNSILFYEASTYQGMKATAQSRFRPARGRDGIALVIVLAFVVLLTGLVVAFFSRAMSERQISNSSGTQTRADLLAQGAVDVIIGDLKEEIAAGSSPSPFATPATGVTIYPP